jgi:hypothetical protein
MPGNLPGRVQAGSVATVRVPHSLLWVLFKLCSDHGEPRLQVAATHRRKFVDKFDCFCYHSIKGKEGAIVRLVSGLFITVYFLLWGATGISADNEARSIKASLDSTNIELTRKHPLIPSIPTAPT